MTLGNRPSTAYGQLIDPKYKKQITLYALGPYYDSMTRQSSLICATYVGLSAIFIHGQYCHQLVSNHNITLLSKQHRQAQFQHHH